jgi:hypothetical protein
MGTEPVHTFIGAVLVGVDGLDTNHLKVLDWPLIRLFLKIRVISDAACIKLTIAEFVSCYELQWMEIEVHG